VKPTGQVSRYTPISPNELDASEAVAYLVKQQFGAIPVLNIDCMDDYHNNQTQRIYQKVAFAAVDFFVGIKPIGPFFGCFNRLAVQDGCAPLRIVSFRNAHFHV
jgi:hypothetical protein